MMDKMSRVSSVYFPNLNGLRLVAVTAVIIHHTEHLKLLHGLPSSWNTSASISLIGKLGVLLFFVLSGFLITYLFLEEECRTGRIGIGRFYLRRALRILPLYYIVVALALFVLPYTELFARSGYGVDVVHKDLLLKFSLYATLFANVVLANVGLVPFAALTWSIGTEEQFYLIWPVLMRYVRNKMTLMFIVIVLYLAGRVLLESDILGYGTWQSWVRGFYAYFIIDSMAIGGLTAVIVHRKPIILNLLVNLPIFYATLTATVVLVVRGTVISYFHNEIYSIFFAVIIVNFCVNRRLGWSLEFEPIHYLGKISYGLYLLHPLAIVASIRLLAVLGWTQNIILYPACLLSTIGLAAISYRFIESPFLALKRRFAIVDAGHNNRTASPT